MLILNRRVGERLLVGDDVVITVVRLKPGQVCVGIDAPKSVSVHRQEIYDRIHRKQPNGCPDAPSFAVEGQPRVTQG